MLLSYRQRRLNDYKFHLFFYEVATHKADTIIASLPLAFQSKADHLRTGHTGVFCFCDLELGLDPMTLICDFDLYILTMYMHTENEVFQRLSELGSPTRQTDRQTDATERITTPQWLKNIEMTSVFVCALHGVVNSDGIDCDEL